MKFKKKFKSVPVYLITLIASVSLSVHIDMTKRTFDLSAHSQLWFN